MTDHAAMIRPILEYSHLVDARLWDRLGEVFVDDGSFVVDGSPVALHGLPAIQEWMSDFAGHPIAHLVTNVVVDLDANDERRATARSLVLGPNSSGTASIGAYADSLVQTPDGWRLKNRRVSIRQRNWGSVGR